MSDTAEAEMASSLTVKDLVGGTSIFAVLGLAASYAALGGFFGAFGVTPEEVGIDSPYSVLRLSLGGAVVLLVFALAFSPIVLLRLSRREAILHDDVPAPQRRQQRLPQWLAWLPVGLIVLAYVGYETYLRFQFKTPFPTKVLVVLCMGSIVTGVLLWSTRAHKGSAFLVRAALTGMALVATVILTLNFVTNQLGTELRSGVRSGLTLLVGFTPPPATVVGEPSTVFLVLGRAEGEWVLFNCTSKEVERRDFAAFTVKVKPTTYDFFGSSVC